MRISTTPHEYKPPTTPSDGHDRHEKAGPRRDPPHFKPRWALSGRLADDPAGQKATGHEQDTGTKRDQRRTTCGGKLSRRSSAGASVLVLHGSRSAVLHGSRSAVLHGSRSAVLHGSRSA